MGKVKIKIKNNLCFNLFSYAMLILTVFSFIIIFMFIVNSILNVKSSFGVFIFVTIGFIYIWKVPKELKTILIFFKGEEFIEIDATSINYKGAYGIFKRSINIKLNELNKYELITLENDNNSTIYNSFFPTKYGMIKISKSKKKNIIFGQSLEKNELEQIFNEIQTKIK